MTDKQIKRALKNYSEGMCHICRLEKAICCPVCICTVINQCLDLLTRNKEEIQKNREALHGQKSEIHRLNTKIKCLRNQIQQLKTESEENNNA